MGESRSATGSPGRSERLGVWGPFGAPRYIDAQVHIWSGGKPANANHRQVERFTKDELLAVCDWLGWTLPARG